MWRISQNYGLLMLLVILLTGALIFCPLGAAVYAQDDSYARFPTEERSAESMVFDLALVRLAGLVGIVVGTAAFVVSLPFSAPGGNAQEAYERLMADPARYTFKRPLGDF
ncbi:MAG: hypothetical protein R6U27_07480 [Desulfobacterales bacterium]